MSAEDRVMAALHVAVERGRAGARADARRALEELWETVGDRGDALHRCTIAHYLADLQDSVADELLWDERALAAVTDLTDERAREYHDSWQVRGFLPSLRLNLADVHHRTGNVAEARHHLTAAVADLDALPDDGYGSMIRSGVERLRQKLAAHHG